MAAFNQKFNFSTPIIWGMFSFIFFAASSVGPAAAESEVPSQVIPLTLETCFQAATQRNETLLDYDQQILQSREQLSQAKGSMLPNISGSASHFIQDGLHNQFENIFPLSQSTVKITANQPIFRGLRDFAVLKQLGRSQEAKELFKEQARIQLYVEVVTHYFNILSLEQEIKNLEAQVALYGDRIEDLHRRAKTGESSASDSLTAQATQAGVQAQAKRIRGQWKTARESLHFLTGLSEDAPLVPYTGEALMPLPAVQTYLSSLESRPDIRAAQLVVEAAEASVSNAKGAHLPSADLSANYYLFRPAPFDQSRWDVQATLTLPIFAGGATQAKVAEAASKRTQAEIALSKARRLAEQEVRALYEAYDTDLEEVKALERSMGLAEKNYGVLKKDYTKGLTRNIDVLSALTQFQESKRALDRSRFTAHSDLLRLKAVSTKQPLPVK